MKASISQAPKAAITLEQISLKRNTTPSLEKWTGGDFPFTAQGRKDLSAIALRFPIDWDQDPFSDRNWRGQLQMWRPLDVYLSQYERTKDKEWLILPLKIVCDWHDFYSQVKTISPLVWTDMHVGLRASKLAYLISQYQMGILAISETEFQKLESMVASHIKFLCDYSHIAMSNHTFFDMVGLGALAQVIDDVASRYCYKVLNDVVPKLAATQFNRYGIHLENSPAYHQFGIDCLKMLDRTGWFSDAEVHSLLVEAEKMLHWFILPDGRILPFGDSNNYKQNTKITETRFKGSNQVLNSSGYVVIRNDGEGDVSRSSYFAVMGALNSKFHKQSDDLTFFWFDGEDILCDVGKYAYKSDVFRSYALSTRAHNTIEIDGENFYKGRIQDEDIYGSAIKRVSSYDWGYIVEAQVWHKRFQTRQQRIFFFQPNKTLIIVDNLSSDSLHSYTQWFHFASDVELISTQTGLSGKTGRGRPFVINHVSSVATDQMLIKGQETPVVQGWISEEYAKVVPNYALGFNCKCNDSLLVTQIALENSKSSVSLNSNYGLDIQIHDRDYKYTFQLVQANSRSELKVLEETDVK